MKLAIRQYGDPVLRVKGARITKIDQRIETLAADMVETMHAANGVGLAAQQVGEALQLTVVDVSAASEDRPSSIKVNGIEKGVKETMPLILINPEVVPGRQVEVGTEGCLSFPEITGEIERAGTVAVHAELLNGESVKIEATGLLARAIQHEVDHLNGILFIDRMTSAAKASLASRLKRLQKETRRNQGKHPPQPVGQSAL